MATVSRRPGWSSRNHPLAPREQRMARTHGDSALVESRPRGSYSRLHSCRLFVARDAELLILDVDRPRAQRENFHGRQKLVALFRIVVEEKLEPSELHRLCRLAGGIRVELEPRRAPAVHVDDDLHARIEF